ncbi:transcription factor E2F/dimerization partner (TDP) family protein [Tieghemostelium lacteum]|uniref:Transcription factor E2F/dimerization partner (TDP) family protein n=1 Tax=Tieghemostelium lacteum TaxID=361077 RepID=A0A152A5I2_TIELA|nr:transcription factor E2F/dimerization partner (TDP) family protein [Tieghemostelium lacteum]|eukprot:KYR01492.1 transcription factor E2F/dimerization partner (TDP) family protein [Tieghemostelium lacteum]
MKRKLEINFSKQQNTKRNHFDFKIFTENDIYINIFKYLCFENNFNRFYLVCKDWYDKFINSNNRLWRELSVTRWCELNSYTNLFSPTSKYFTIPESKSKFKIFYDGSKGEPTPKYVYDEVQFGKPTITYEGNRYRARNKPPVQYLIRNRNSLPKSWQEIFKERYIKENITREYYKLHLQDYSDQEDKRSIMRKVKSISSIPSLNKSIYTNIENTKIIPILDSVIYSDLVSQRDNYFHDIDTGMEQIDYMLCRGSIMNLNGDIVEFSFRQLHTIEGARVEYFYRDPFAHIQFGKYYHVISELYTWECRDNSSQYQAYYQFINEITKLINGNTPIFSGTDIEQLISYIIPTYAFNNEYYQFYPLRVENNITNDIPTSTINRTTCNNSNNNPNITGNITIFSTIIKYLSNDNEFNRLFLVCKQWTHNLNYKEAIWKEICFERWKYLEFYNSVQCIENLENNTIDNSNNIKNNKKNEGNIIKNRNSYPNKWSTLFKERYIKENIILKYFNFNLLSIKRADKIEKLIKRIIDIIEIPCLDKMRYYKDIDNIHLIGLLDSVIFSNYKIKRSDFYGGMDSGMGLKESMSLSGTLLSIQGKIIPFSFDLLWCIEGGHSDGYYSEGGFIIFGNEQFKIDYHIYPNEEYPLFDEFISNTTKLINGDIDIFTSQDTKSFLKYILPNYVFNNPYFNFYELEIIDN